MKTRDLALTPRKEGTREQRTVTAPIHFDLNEIKLRFDEGIEDAKLQVALAKKLDAEGNAEACSSILRAQIVTCEALLDFYIHELSKYCLYEMFCGIRAKSQKYGNLKVPLARVHTALESADSREWFFEHVNSELSTLCFLGSESMKGQLNLIGVPYEGVLESAFPDLAKADRKKMIDRLYGRRNRIAHQGDRDHATAEQASIDDAYVMLYLSRVESIANAIHACALNG